MKRKQQQQLCLLSRHIILWSPWWITACDKLKMSKVMRHRCVCYSASVWSRVNVMCRTSGVIFTSINDLRHCGLSAPRVPTNRKMIQLKKVLKRHVFISARCIFLQAAAFPGLFEPSRLHVCEAGVSVRTLNWAAHPWEADLLHRRPSSSALPACAEMEKNALCDDFRWISTQNSPHTKARKI